MMLNKPDKTSLLKTMLLSCAFMVVASTGSEAASLRDKLSTEASVVTLGDLFTDTGELADEVVMPAPAPGKRKAITSFELNKIATHYKLDWERPAYLKRVYIHREGTHFSTSSLKPVVLEQIRDAGMDADIEIKIYGQKKGFYLPYGYEVSELTFESFELNDSQDRFTATLNVPVSDIENTSMRLTGMVQVVRLVPMLNRLFTPGEVISETDIVWKRYPAKRVTLRTIVSAQELIGQSVRRAISAGKLLFKNEIVRPIMVAKGSIVSITLRSGSLLIKARGRALANGGKGDTIRIMNTNSKRTLEATVVSPNRVIVQVRSPINLATR